VLPAVKTPGVGAQLHLLVTENPQLGEHELLPALTQVAEKHQPQRFAQLADQQGEQAGGMPRAPLAEGARLWLRGGQLGNQLWLAPAGAGSGGGQQGGKLVPAQQLPELLGSQRVAVTAPIHLEQGAGGG